MRSWLFGVLGALGFLYVGAQAASAAPRVAHPPAQARSAVLKADYYYHHHHYHHRHWDHGRWHYWD